MNHKVLSTALLISNLVCNAAWACGQVACDEPAAPGKSVHIRGYGYGFEGGIRPVTLRWVATGGIAGTTQIDGNGDFSTQVVAPDSPGMHQLVVTVGDADPTPVNVTVPVLMPWYRQPLAALGALQLELASALAGVLMGGSVVALYLRRSRRRHGAGVPG